MEHPPRAPRTRLVGRLTPRCRPDSYVRRDHQDQYREHPLFGTTALMAAMSAHSVRRISLLVAKLSTGARDRAACGLLPRVMSHARLVNGNCGTLP